MSEFYNREEAQIFAPKNALQFEGHLIDFFKLLLKSWSKETCAPRMQNEWSPENPTKGQCSITAFLVQDVFGGEVFGIPLGDGNFHCYNEINGKSFDLTCAQFGEKASSFSYKNQVLQSRENHFQKAEKKVRYELLKERVKQAIKSSAS